MRILERIERYPNAIFSESGLLRDSKEEFEALRDLGLLRLVAGVPAFYHSEETSYAVARDGETLLGLQLEDEEADVITLEAAHVRRWTGDVPRIAAHITNVNCLRGRPERITDRLWFLGESTDAEAILLGLFGDGQTFENQVASLPSRLPDSYSSFLVVCPTFSCPPTLLKRLELIGVRVCDLAEDDSFSLSIGTTAGQAVADFSFSSDYRSVTLRGEHFKLSPQRAKLVKILHRAWRVGHPEMPWEQIRAQLRAEPDPFYADRIQDVFKGFQGDWHELVRTAAPGVHALNL